MQPYQFMGNAPRFYPRWEDQSFTAEPGEVREFVNPPTDGLWIPYVPPKAPKSPSKAEEDN